MARRCRGDEAGGSGGLRTARITMDRLGQVVRYHQETKHHFFRYARALGYLDWANQPDPFRRYIGAPLIPLPHLRSDEPPVSPAYRELYRPRVPGEALSLRSVSRFCEYALSLTAWKQAGGARWALRSNPSSGNLHPTEGYLILPALPGAAPRPALFHYAPKEHGLELRAAGEASAYAALLRGFPPDAWLLAFSSVHWREAWKYGERAYRYCQHDVGHAIGAARLSASALGWRMLLLEAVGDGRLAALLGLDRKDDFAEAEAEAPDCVAVVWPDRGDPIELSLDLPPEPLERLWVEWWGRANRLSADDPVRWDIIDEVTAAAWKPDDGEPRVVRIAPDAGRAAETPAGAVRPEGVGSFEAPDDLYPPTLPADRIIHQRRSAVAFDGTTGLGARRFYSLLARVLPGEPGGGRVPWDAWPWEACVSLAIFVHRVEGLVPGLYVLVRNPRHLAGIRAAMARPFRWQRPDGCPEGLALYLLEEGDARRAATQVSCHQEIAGDGAFALGMVAEFDGALRRHGPWFYRRLFWETGLIGQVLYLEAEAAGVRATGIGCFFDDPMHELLGISDRSFQSLYHFTVGGPVEDPRLTTLPPYGADDGR